MRVQFYPDTILDKRLREEAERMNIPVSLVVIEALNNYFGLSTEKELSPIAFEQAVFAEVQEYLKTAKEDTTFTLNVSKTFKCAGQDRDAVLKKARCSKRFRQVLGVEPFENVERVCKDGKQIFSTGERMALFRIIS